MIAATLRRLVHRADLDATTVTAAFARRACLPARTRAFDRLRREWRQWLGSAPVASRAAPLDAARDEFLAAIDDVAGTRAARLEQAIDHAGSLRDLWYLRTELFSVVAGSFGQHEAEQRIARLNRHFPTRSPRSGFAAFDAVPRG